MSNLTGNKVKNMNPMMMTDFYKTIHHLAYVPKLEYLVSYWTPRMSRIEGIDKVVCVGMQPLIVEHLIEKFNRDFFNRDWEELEAEYKRVIANTMTVQASDTTEMKKLYDLGYLPIEIKAVDEGTRVNIKTPMFEITNTVKGFGWLVNFLETYISVNIWHIMTTATIGYRYREIVHKFFEQTVVDGVESSACGDFSMRGMTSEECSMRGSAGHLMSFTGTATIPAIVWLEQYYNCDCTKEVVGRGVPSTEHSVMSSYGRDGEFECYRHLIEDVFKTGPLSMVSDTYDYWNVITNYLPRLKDTIMNRDGKIIIRGDSGDPIDIICGELKANEYIYLEGMNDEEVKAWCKNKAENEYEDNDAYSTTVSISYKIRTDKKYYVVRCDYEKKGINYVSNVINVEFVENRELTPADKGTVELLWDIFGGTVNSKGYKVLDPHIGAIYGDGITLERAEGIYTRLADKGFAVNNCTLGIGSWSYIGQLSRDSLGFALKSTDSVVDGVERIIYKDPITDKIKGNNFKKSQKGRCYVYRDGENILYKDELTFEEINSPEYADNLLKPIFRDGKLLVEWTLSEVRNRLHKGAF